MNLPDTGMCLRKEGQACRGGSKRQGLAKWLVEPCHRPLTHPEQVQDLAVPLVMLTGQNSLLVE